MVQEFRSKHKYGLHSRFGGITVHPVWRSIVVLEVKDVLRSAIAASLCTPYISPEELTGSSQKTQKM